MTAVLPAHLPKNITSYDFLKTLAVILMITDHLGYYFFPDESWFRIFGRMCVPIWFFLIGYANTREIPRSLYIGAILLTVSAVVAGQYLLPLTILVTLGLARRWIDWIGRRALRTYETLAGMFFFLFLLSWPTELLFEYGTAGILFSFYGYVARHRADIPFNRRAITLFAFAVGLTFIISQSLMLASMSEAQALVLVFGVFGVIAGLWRFRPAEFPRLSRYTPRPFVFLLQLFGRRTLEIYVLHVLAFRALAMVLDPERFGLFEWAVMPEGALGFIKSILGIG